MAEILPKVGEARESDLLALSQEELVRFALLAQTEASFDSLTGLQNRRRVEDAFCQQEVFAVGILDVDHFKGVNDTYGHDVGDDVLRMIAEILRKNSGRSACIGRWGGEEFVLCLTDPYAFPEMVFEAVRQAVAEYAFVIRSGDRTGETIGVTISIGWTDAYGSSLGDVVGCADKLLYQAKNAGRNRVCGPR